MHAIKNKITGKILKVIGISGGVYTLLDGTGRYSTLDEFSVRAYYTKL